MTKEEGVKVLKTVFVVAALLCLSAASTRAQDVSNDRPLFDWSRFTVAGGMNYVWYAAPFDKSAPVPPFGKEWEAGLYASYNLTPHLSLAGSTVYGFDNKTVQDRLGLRFRFGSGEK